MPLRGGAQRREPRTCGGVPDPRGGGAAPPEELCRYRLGGAVPAGHEGAAPGAGGTKRLRRGKRGPGRAAAHRPFKAGAERSPCLLPPPPRRLGTGPGPLRALIGRPPGPVTWEGGARSPQPPGRHFGWKVWNFRALRAGGGGGARPALPGPYQPPRARPAASPTRPAPRGGSPERSRREGRSVARRGGGSGGAVPPRPAGRGCAPPPRAGSGSKFARRSRHARQEAR